MAQGNFGTPAGAEEQFYVISESSFGTFTKPTSASGIRVISSSFTTNQERVNRRDKRNSRSVSGRITRKRGAEFTIVVYALPSGTAGTPPDISDLLEAVFGTYTNTPATSDVYTLDRDINKSFSLHRILGEVWSESLFGAVIDKLDIRFQGEEEIELEISGMAKDFVQTGKTTLAASAASGASTIEYTDDYHLMANSVISIDGNNNSGAGYLVSSVNETTNVATISPALEADVSNGGNIIPYFPSPTTAGDPLGCFPGTITIDGTTYYFTEFSVSLSNQAQMRTDEFGQETARGYQGAGFREVTFEATLYLGTDNLGLKGLSRQFGTSAIIVQAGDTAGRIMKVNMPTAEFNIIQTEIPEEEEVMFNLSGTAIAPSVNESEISLTFQ